MKNPEYIDEPEGSFIGFPFNVPDEFLDGKDEEEEVMNVKRILGVLRYMGVGA